MSFDSLQLVQLGKGLFVFIFQLKKQTNINNHFS